MLNFELCLCSYAAPRAETVASIEKFRITSKLVHFLNIYCGDALLSRNRSIACHRFLKNNFAPYMIFLDDDIVFEPRHLEKIYNDLADGYDIVGGLYAVGDGSQSASYGWDGKMLVDGSIQDIEYLATGFMGISRKALLKVKDELKLPLLNEGEWAECVPYFECGRNVTRKGKPIYISEDWDFCDKARKAGFKVYIDTGVQVGHMKMHMVTMDDVMKGHLTPSDIKETISRKQRLQSLTGLVDDYAEFNQTTTDEIRKRVKNWDTDFISRSYLNSGLNLEEYYRSKDMDILDDLLVFNLNNSYIDTRLEKLTGIQNKSVLDFGCGLGTSAIYLASQGNEVTGYDINPNALEFCKLRASKQGLKITFTDKFPDVTKFDFIVALDVFEHIEDLKELLLRFGKTKKGTVLIHNDMFKQRLSVHIDHSEHFDNWLKEAGFTLKDEYTAIKL